jgi:ParB-like nuclease domain
MHAYEVNQNPPEIILLPIDDIKPYWRNARRNDATVEVLKLSIQEYGYRQLILVDADHTIILGHARLKALRALGYKEVHVQIARDLSEEKVKAYRIIDNKAGEKSRWDLEQLVPELRSINLGAFELAFPELKIAPIDVKFDTPAVNTQNYSQISFDDHNDEDDDTDAVLASRPNDAFERTQDKLSNQFTEASKAKASSLMDVECPECGSHFTVAKE